MKSGRGAASFTVRRARLDDAPAMERIERESFRRDHFNLRQFQYLVTRARGVVWVAVDRDEILGFVIVLAPARWTVARIYDIAIARAARGRGLGRLLMQRAWAWTRRQGRARLILEVAQSNRNAIRLYENLGFVRARPLRDYYGPGRHGWRYVYGY